MLVHKWLYYYDEPIISDHRYDVSYAMYEPEGLVGSDYESPPIPEYAKLPEEEKRFNVPLWDHMAEFRRRK